MIDWTDIVFLFLIFSIASYYFQLKLKANKKERASPTHLISTTTSYSNNLETTNPTNSIDSGLAHKLFQLKKQILIIYGSQTGTAEDFATRISKELAQYHLSSLVIDPDDYDMSELEHVPSTVLVIFVVATYGEGEPTDNAISLYDYLKTSSENESNAQLLSHINYAVFGLGNRTYTYFNLVAHHINSYCQRLGAKRVGELGEGDDDRNLEEDFSLWMEATLKCILNFFQVDLAKLILQAHEPLHTLEYPLEVSKASPSNPAFNLKIVKSDLSDGSTMYSCKNPFYAKLTQSTYCFQEDAERQCLHLELDMKGSNLNYSHGDHVLVYPSNSMEAVEALAQAARLDLSLIFTMKTRDPSMTKRKYPFPCPTTLRTCLLHFLDIQQPPKQHCLKTWLGYLSHASQEAKKMIETLATDINMYTHHILNAHCTVAELLSMYPIPNFPLEVLLETFSRIQPRYYSISSSPKHVGAHMVHLTAVVLTYPSVNQKKIVKGLCTNYFERLHQQFLKSPAQPILVPIAIRHTHFKLPRHPHAPILMVGPGTGVAPFRGFVQERLYIKKQKGTAILVYGCRNSLQDYLFKSEWPDYLSQQGLTSLWTAFSRDGPTKVYVQHRLMENKKDVWQWLFHQQGYLYVCGDAKHMARDIYQWILSIAQELGEMNLEQAERWTRELKQKGRYLEDVWS